MQVEEVRGAPPYLWNARRPYQHFAAEATAIGERYARLRLFLPCVELWDRLWKALRKTSEDDRLIEVIVKQNVALLVTVDHAFEERKARVELDQESGGARDRGVRI